MGETKKSRTCFVVGPIGAADSDTRIHADWLLEEIIEPVFSARPEFQVIRSDKIASPGMIDAQVIQHLFESDLVIADLSRLNANAFYEIGIRHMHQRPIIHMQAQDDEIPFDISLYRAIKFSRARPSDLRKAREELKLAVDAVLTDGYKVDNPITRARGQIRLEQTATPEQQVVMEQLKAFNDRLDKMEFSRKTTRRVSYRPMTITESDSDIATVYVFIEGAMMSAEADKIKVLETMEKNAPILDFHVRDDGIEFKIQKGFLLTRKWRDLQALLMGYSSVRSVDDIPF